MSMEEMKKEPLPFKRGDRVIDDNGETGTIDRFGVAQWDATGKLVDYGFVMRYDWNMDSYGKERKVSKGEFGFVQCTFCQQLLVDRWREEDSVPYCNERCRDLRASRFGGQGE